MIENLIQVKSSKEKIIEKIINNRKNIDLEAVSEKKREENIHFFRRKKDNLNELFLQELQKINGTGELCRNEHDFTEKLHQLIKQENIDRLYCADKAMQKRLENAGIVYENDAKNLENADAVLLPCDYFIARTGSIVITLKKNQSRKVHAYPPIQIFAGSVSQILFDLNEALDLIYKDNANPGSQVTVITGPSRTADIEKTLILGAHEPKKLFVFISASDTW